MYQEQIERLTKNPHMIPIDWAHAIGIFKYLGPMSNQTGCLIFVCHNQNMFVKNKDGTVDKDMTSAIKRDHRIPRIDKLGVEHLEIFREWVTKFDKLK